MSTFHVWLVTAWTNLLSWFGVSEQKVASFLYPIFQDAKQIVEKDLLKDIIAGVPVVAAALLSSPPTVFMAAEEFLLPLLKAQGVELASSTVEAFKAGLVAQAQASLATVSSSSGSSIGATASAV